jgi:hypothetical protein
LDLEGGDAGAGAIEAFFVVGELGFGLREESLL